MNISDQQIQQIVRQVVADLDHRQPAAPLKEGVRSASPAQATVTGVQDGVFERVEDAVDAAHAAQQVWVTRKVEERQRVIEAIRRCARMHVEEWSRKIVEETGMGRYEDKVEKHLAIINKTPGAECLTTDAISGDTGLMLEEYGPYGVICAITPTTNPTETIINNTISMIAGGNTVVFNVHPRAKRVSAECLQALHRAMVEAGAPPNLITMTREPTMDAVRQLSENPKVRLMVGTGGMGMVNALLRSGKKCVGAGAGNPPVIVDETADVELAARKIYEGASFDNNILCFAEKEVFAVQDVYDGLLFSLRKQGAHLITPEQTQRLTEIVLKAQPGGGYEVNKDWVGQDATRILDAIGIQGDPKCRLVICEVAANHPLVTVEQMMPVLPIVRCANFEEAVQFSVAAEHGNRHTASIFSQNVTHMTVFGRAIETTIFVKNSATKAGVGIGGEGHCTMTIAGPTGEGITCAKSFCRRRRCVLAEGGLRVV